MQKLTNTFSLLALIFLSGIMGCSTDIDLNAPDKDIWVVYGILNAQDSVQYIRVSNVFLPESNVIDFAKENDQSAKGLQITLEGGNQSFVAEEVDSVLKDPEDGTFFPYTTLYKIRTEGNQQLKGRTRYDLRIIQPGNDTFLLETYTWVPESPQITKPNVVSGAGQTKCLRPVNLENDYELEFVVGREEEQGNAGSFEVRVYLDYAENGQAKQAMFGPTLLFERSQRCIPSTAAGCYNFRSKEILQSFYNQINPQPVNLYTYEITEQTQCDPEPDNLPAAFRFELTAMDEFLTKYRTANDPKFIDFNTVRPEFTNIEGTVEALGIFGSINSNFAKARLSQCSAFLLDINNTPRPASVCEL
ncbi:MAG: hypothetical protein AAF206_16305 [Bacteroidota bacterium]